MCKKYTNDHSSVTELLWGLHWLPIKARVQYKILLLVYSALNTGTPPYLAALLTRKSFCKVTRTSHKVNILNVPAHGRGRHSVKAFSVVGPTMWNELLTNELRECTSGNNLNHSEVRIISLHTKLSKLTYSAGLLRVI